VRIAPTASFHGMRARQLIAAVVLAASPLVGDTWIVEGSLPSSHQLGGTAVAEISRTDGRILRVSHGK
jgi:hypothetical protein